MIVIEFDPHKSVFDSLVISLDKKVVPYLIDNNKLLIDIEDSNDGLHNFSVALTRLGDRLEIQDVIINGSGSRQNLYFSFIQDQHDNIIQPCTVIWDINQTWHYPFALPFSHWHNLLTTKFRDDVLGKNLRDQFKIYWPESLDPGHAFPQLIRDYFSRDFNFTVIPKDDHSRLRVPYQILQDFHVPELVYQELLSQIDLLQEKSTVPSSQYKYNLKDQPDLDVDKSWSVVMLTEKKAWKEDFLKNFPETISWVESLGLDMLYCYVGILQPGQYISPHCDSKAHLESKYQGCCQLYIPIKWKSGCYFKFADIGMLPTKPCIINNDKYVHALINQSSEIRLSLGVICDPVASHSRWGLTLTD